MWVLLAISLFAGNDQIQVAPMRQYTLSEDCATAKDLLTKGHPGFAVNGATTHYVCLKKPRG